MTLTVMTANLLREGDVVYLTAAGSWSLWLHEAEIARDEDGAARLEASAEKAVADRLVVSPYLMNVAEADGRPRPLGTREIIRAKGPTTHPHFGKQAMTGANGAGGAG